MSCDRNYGVAGYPECSGNGKCVSGFCVCDVGWTGVGDLALYDGYDCDIHLFTVKVLCIIYLFTSFPSLIYQFRSLFKITRLISTKATCFIACFLTNVCGYLYAILKLISFFDFLLGKSIALAFTQSVLTSAAVSIGTSYTLLILKFLEGYFKMLRINQKNKLKRYSWMWKKAMLVLPFFLFIAMFSTLTTGAVRHQENSDNINIAVSSSLLIGYTLLLLCLGSIFRIFIAEITLYLSNRNKIVQVGPIGGSNVNNLRGLATSDVEELLKSCLFIYYSVLPVIICGWVLYASNVCWKFFRRKATYQVLFQLIIINIVSPFFVNGLESVSKKHATVLAKRENNLLVQIGGIVSQKVHPSDSANSSARVSKFPASSSKDIMDFANV